MRNALRLVDAIAIYHADLAAAGTLRLQAAFNHTATGITRISETPPQLAGFDNTLFSRVPPNDIEFRRFTCAQPKDSLRLSGDWRRGPIAGLGRASRFGDYCSLEAIDQIDSAAWVTDVMAEYTVKAVRLGAGIDNMMNVLPDANLVSVSNRGGRTFPRNAPFGFNGRYVYGRIRYTF